MDRQKEGWTEAITISPSLFLKEHGDNYLMWQLHYVGEWFLDYS